MLLPLSMQQVSLRTVCKAIKCITDSHLIGKGVSVSGSKLASLHPMHYLDAERLFGNLFRHMEKLDSLRISGLHCIGPLRNVLPSISQQITQIEISDSDRWLKAGNSSLIFHLSGLSSATRMLSFKLTVKSAYYQVKKGHKACSISSLAALLPRSIETLDLGASLWSASAVGGLLPLFKRLNRLTSLTLTRCPTLSSISNINASRLRRLIHLDLNTVSYSQPFKDLKGLGSLTLAINLQTLKLPRILRKDFSYQETINAGFSLFLLTELVISLGDSDNPAHLPSDLACLGLRSLVLYGSPSSIDSLAALTLLSSLELSVARTHSFEPLSALTSLVKLSLNDLYGDFLDLSPLSSLTALKSLDLSSIGDEVLFDALSSLVGLTKLELYWEESFPSDGCDLNSISALTQLVHLSITAGYPRDADISLHTQALMSSFDRFSALRELSIPIALDRQAKFLSHLTALTSLTVQNSFPSSNAAANIDDEQVEIKGTSLLLAIALLPSLSEIQFEYISEFSDGINSLKLLSNDADKFPSVTGMTFEFCGLSSTDLRDLQRAHRLKKLSIRYSHGFSAISVDDLEREGLELDIECDDDYDEEEEEEEKNREMELWRDRFLALHEGLQAQILMDSALRSPANSLDGPVAVRFGVLRLVCSHWQRLVDRSKKFISLDIPALIRSLPSTNQQVNMDGKEALLLYPLELSESLDLDESDAATVVAETVVGVDNKAMPDLIDSSSEASFESVFSPSSMSSSPVDDQGASSSSKGVDFLDPSASPSLPLVMSSLKSLMAKLEAIEHLTLVHPQVLLAKPVLESHCQGWHLLDLLSSLDDEKGRFKKIKMLTLAVPSLSNKELSKFVTSSSEVHPIFTESLKSANSSSLAYLFPALESLSIVPTDPDEKPHNLCPDCLEKESKLHGCHLWMKELMNPTLRGKNYLTSIRSLAEALAPLDHFSGLHLSFCHGVSSLRPLAALKLESLFLGSLHTEDAARDVRRLTYLTRLILHGLDSTTNDLTQLLAPLTRLNTLEMNWLDPPGSEMMMPPMLMGPFSFVSRLVVDIALTIPPLPDLQALELNGACVSSFSQISSQCPEVTFLELIDIPQELSVKNLAHNMGLILVKLILVSVRINSIVSLKDCLLLETLVLSDVRQKKTKPSPTKDRLKLLSHAIPPCGNIVSDLARNTPPKLKTLTLSGLSFYPWWAPELSNNSWVRSLMHVRPHSIIGLLVRNPNLMVINLFATKGLTRKILSTLCCYERGNQTIYYRTHDLAAEAPPADPGAVQVPPPFIPVFDVTKRSLDGRQLLVTDFFCPKNKRTLPRPVKSLDKNELHRMKQLTLYNFFSAI